NQSAATGWFRYDTTNPGACNDAFGIRAPASGGSSVGAGGTPVAFSQPLTALSPGTTYYFCALAANSVGASFGAVLSFTTPSAPVVITVPPQDVNNTSAVLQGLVNPGLVATNAWFRYSISDPGTCDDVFGVRAPSVGTPVGAGGSAVGFSQ